MVKDFGEFLKASREQQGVTQEQLASMVGCTRRAIQYYEANMRSPGLYMADDLLTALGVSLEIGKTERRPHP